MELRSSTSVKTVLNELSAVKTVNIIKLFAYKNGDGRLKPGELLIGTSLNEVVVILFILIIFADKSVCTRNITDFTVL